MEHSRNRKLLRRMQVQQVQRYETAGEGGVCAHSTVILSLLAGPSSC